MHLLLLVFQEWKSIVLFIQGMGGGYRAGFWEPELPWRKELLIMLIKAGINMAQIFVSLVNSNDSEQAFIVNEVPQCVTLIKMFLCCRYFSAPWPEKKHDWCLNHQNITSYMTFSTIISVYDDVRLTSPIVWILSITKLWKSHWIHFIFTRVDLQGNAYQF